MRRIHQIPEDAMGSDEDLRTRLCAAVNIFPEELEHNLPNNIGLTQMESLERVVQQERLLAQLDVLDSIEEAPDFNKNDSSHFYDYVNKRRADLTKQLKELEKANG